MSSTKAQNEFSSLMELALQGVVIEITKMKKPKAVLLSMEKFEQLLSERVDPLAALRSRFDARFAQMQTPQAEAGINALFEATSKELGQAAVKRAKRRA